jgi:hypothetical protein
MEEQCKGITKRGTRCKNKSNLVDGYCRVHLDQVTSEETVVPANIPTEMEQQTNSEPEKTESDYEYTYLGDTHNGSSIKKVIFVSVAILLCFFLVKCFHKRD